MAVVTRCRQNQRNNCLPIRCLHKMKGTKNELLKIETIITEYLQKVKFCVLISILKSGIKLMGLYPGRACIRGNRVCRITCEKGTCICKQMPPRNQISLLS